MTHLDQEWRKSSDSGAGGCLAAKWDGARVLVRDTKHPDGPVLVFDRREWAAFLAGVRNGEFDLPEALSA